MGTARITAADSERMIAVLVPAPAPGRPVPVPAPLPTLPARTLPAAGAPHALLLDTARMDLSGRVSARHLLTALGWRPGARLDVDVADGVLLITAASDGGHVVGGRGEVSLPAPARRMCGIEPGQSVLLVACPPHGVLLVHPVSVVADLLTAWHSGLACGGCDGRR